MEYHSDRFNDHSLMVYKGKRLIALLPANIKNKVLHSHQGLSYGGLVLSKKIKFNEVLEAFKTVLIFLEKEGIKTLHLKPLPKIYHELPADEIDYILFLLKAKRNRADLSSTIKMQSLLKIQSNRIEGVKKAIKQNLKIIQTDSFDDFWNQILIPNLNKRHDASPVHTLDEITLLAKRFPKNIHQFNVLHKDTIVGGATIFESKQVAHVQYISAESNKQTLGTLDFLFEYLINTKFKNKRYFDFGISNVNKGLNINEGLLYWKECFGARSIIQEDYEIETNNHHFLETVFL